MKMRCAWTTIFALSILGVLAPSPCLCQDEEEEPQEEPDQRKLPPLAWQTERRLPPVDRVFPHVIHPDLVYVTTSQGIVRTQDGGKTWGAPKCDGLRDAGELTVLAQSPCDPSLLYVGTRAKGVFKSADAGETWTPSGGADRGLANACIVDLRFLSADPTWQCLLASHGKAAAGLSFTEDGGATWRIVGGQKFFNRFLLAGNAIVGEGAPTNEPDSWTLTLSYDYGANWCVVSRDVRPMWGSASLLGARTIYWATVDAGILRSKEDGLSWERVGPKGDFAWAGTAVAWGGTAREEVVCAFDPNVKGFLRSNDRMKTWCEDNKGLYVGRFVKDGANIAVNANGSTYYASVNNALYVGRTAPATGGPELAGLRCDPPVLRLRLADIEKANETLRPRPKNEPQVPADQIEAARKVLAASTLNFRVEARHPDGPETIRGVEINLDILAGARDAQMFDDGKHGDDAARDGVYGFQMPYSPRWFQRLKGDRRPPLPGTTAVTVTITDRLGNAATGVVAFGVYLLPSPRGLWSPSQVRWWKPKTEGPVSCEATEKTGPDGKRHGFAIASKAAEPWTVRFSRGEEQNLYGQKFVCFQMKLSQAPKDLFFQLTDSLGEMDDWSPSKEIALIASGCLKPAAGEWQKVRVPIAPLIAGTAFKRPHCSGWLLRAPAGTPVGTYQVDDVSIEP